MALLEFDIFFGPSTTKDGRATARRGELNQRIRIQTANIEQQKVGIWWDLNNKHGDANLKQMRQCAYIQGPGNPEKTIFDCFVLAVFPSWEHPILTFKKSGACDERLKFHPSRLGWNHSEDLKHAMRWCRKVLFFTVFAWTTFMFRSIFILNQLWRRSYDLSPFDGIQFHYWNTSVCLFVCLFKSVHFPIRLEQHCHCGAIVTDWLKPWWNHILGWRNPPINIYIGHNDVFREIIWLIRVCVCVYIYMI